MRPSATVVKAGLSATAAVLLLTACSSGSDVGAAAPSTAAPSTAAPSTAGSSSVAPTTASGSSAPDSAVTAFCRMDISLTASLNQAIAQANSDPTKLAPALQQAADQYAAVDPPAAIRQDWQSLTAGIQALATNAAGIDFTQPDAASKLGASLGGTADQLKTAASNVQAYATANCPIPSATSSSAAAPTS